jgi:Fe2+ transport system protein FeoA
VLARSVRITCVDPGATTILATDETDSHLQCAASMLKRLLRREPPAVPASRCGACPLAACATGCHAAVVRMECEHGEAHRLRGLGLFEGTTVRVLDSRNGMLLEVKGVRLALGQALARAITVLPIGG